MRKIFFVTAAMLALCGCSTFSNIESGLSALMGRPASEAFGVLGYPSGKQQFGSDTVYYWSISRSGMLMMPQTATTTGYVGRTPIYGATQYNTAMPVNYNCQIKLVADSSDTLKNWEYEGNIGGCQSYASRLKGLARPNQNASGESRGRLRQPASK